MWPAQGPGDGGIIDVTAAHQPASHRKVNDIQDEGGKRLVSVSERAHRGVTVRQGLERVDKMERARGEKVKRSHGGDERITRRIG